jgi:hypothetical protein
MNTADIPKTAITTPFRLFEFTCMTFGRRNVGNTFQRLMDCMLSGVENASPYIYNILVFSKSMEDHSGPETVSLLTAARLTANAEKCESSIEFLGHTVSTNGIAPLPSRVVAIASHPCPNNIKKL